MTTDPGHIARDYVAALDDAEFQAFAAEARTPGAQAARPADHHNPHLTTRRQPADHNERNHP